MTQTPRTETEEFPTFEKYNTPDAWKITLTHGACEDTETVFLAFMAHGSREEVWQEFTHYWSTAWKEFLPTSDSSRALIRLRFANDMPQFVGFAPTDAPREWNYYDNEYVPLDWDPDYGDAWLVDIEPLIVIARKGE